MKVAIVEGLKYLVIGWDLHYFLGLLEGEKKSFGRSLNLQNTCVKRGHKEVIENDIYIGHIWNCPYYGEVGGLQSISDFYPRCSPWDNDLKLIIYNMFGPRFSVDWRGQFVLASYCDMMGYPWGKDAIWISSWLILFGCPVIFALLLILAKYNHMFNKCILWGSFKLIVISCDLSWCVDFAKLACGNLTRLFKVLIQVKVQVLFIPLKTCNCSLILVEIEPS